jgi:hypothetical protein
MHDLNQEPPGNARSFVLEEMVSASELKDFVYCSHSWLLNQQGFRITNTAAEERKAGTARGEDCHQESSSTPILPRKTYRF